MKSVGIEKNTTNNCTNVNEQSLSFGQNFKHSFVLNHCYLNFAETSVPNFFHTMRRQFTDSEWIQIRISAEESEQLKTFYRLWVKYIILF